MLPGSNIKYKEIWEIMWKARDFSHGKFVLVRGFAYFDKDGGLL